MFPINVAFLKVERMREPLSLHYDFGNMFAGELLLSNCYFAMVGAVATGRNMGCFHILLYVAGVLIYDADDYLSQHGATALIFCLNCHFFFCRGDVMEIVGIGQVKVSAY